jgi:hypothetical protein
MSDGQSHHVYHFLGHGWEFEIACPVPKGPGTPRTQTDLFAAACAVLAQRYANIRTMIARAKREREEALLRELNNKCRM